MLSLEVIIDTHIEGVFGSHFFFSKHRQAQWENYIWFRNKTTLGQKKKKKEKMIESFASLRGQFLIM